MLMRIVRDTWHFSAAKSDHQLRNVAPALVDENKKQREWEDSKEAAARICEKAWCGHCTTTFGALATRQTDGDADANPSPAGDS